VVSQYFDRIEYKVQKREFVTHTGYVGSKRITVLSTGIGTDNIDIVISELDALFNIDLNTKTVRSVVTPLTFIRLGTSGCLVEDFPVDTILVSELAIGLDSLMHYYPQSLPKEASRLQTKIRQVFSETAILPIIPYLAMGSPSLIKQLGKGLPKGITLTATGFYAPQGRPLRLTPNYRTLLDSFQQINLSDLTPLPISNLEMETAGIYGLAQAMGHRAISFNALLANRVTGKFSKNPQKAVDRLVKLVLSRIMTKIC